MTDRKARYRVTSFDVAERAGVSQSTVSRALAGSSAITEATRAKVMKAAEELGYVVDERAARLRRGKTGTLAVVVIGRPEEAASDVNPFYFSLLGSVCAAAAAQGLETLVSFQSEADQFFGKYEERGQADGLIVIGTTVNEPAWEYFRELASDGRAVAFWGSPFGDLEWVRSDNYEGGIIAAKELMAAGCSNIVHIGTIDSPQQQFRERYEGYEAALQKQGLIPHIQPVDDALDREQQGRDAIAQLVENGTKFDGLFVACDSMALGALEELHARGIEVPKSCSIVGFDGIRAGQHSNPPLTSIEPDFDVAGAMLVRTVLGEDEAAERRVPVRLLHRGSVRRG
ncbi:LacI family DNA-binding transcriptional regulator [Pontixanthobacter gangjinensis]|uniref:LacI family DNA-binding transcriptional regulator n=1 Tax=Pontixanthobacter gangjinensis TaxID=1028742 RepID=A0A6I4SKC0_9SPHN|nr:substrate-binding domain-containing protein [Pontixanthobacter gangjinensis]MXO56163.1 LacI family DNA-binding transcriptional regulator [Pontixanthobacter gangjinensis]